MRLTIDGWIVAAMTVALGIVATVAGNNLLFLVVGVLVSLWVLEAILGSWNLRGLRVGRRLPQELFAELDAHGSLVVHNGRRWLPSLAVTVEELGVGLPRTVGAVPPEGSRAVSSTWRFENRGRVELRGLYLSSRFPFGWIHHGRMVWNQTVVLVYPKPMPGETRVEEGPPELMGERRISRGAVGEYAGLRPYEWGDSLRGIHWATSARVGRYMVVQRADGEQIRTQIAMRALLGPAWELEISRVTGDVVRAFRRGWSVGLTLEDGTVLPARGGPGWRRTLLDILAMRPVDPT